MAAASGARPGTWNVLVPVVVALATALGGWQVAQRPTTALAAGELRDGAAVYTVTHVELVSGLSDEELGGMSHGIQGLVTPEKVLVQVTVAVRAGGSRTGFDPGVLHASPDGAGAGIPPVGGTLSPGVLSAHAHTEGSLSYVVPRDGASWVLRAPGSARSVPLTDVDRAGPEDAAHVHTPAAAGPTAADTSPGVTAPGATAPGDPGPGDPALGGPAQAELVPLDPAPAPAAAGLTPTTS